ncbi:hypothetical protein R6242_22220 [Iodobacter sp. CM08]|uniref:hypothetical protein n=1 Tax=Iodobacter sp. CM08 TaxID=3085902 RepID=UPI0029829010|nr:hypothetical protein [Iodobacter sp. CM08]MDW5419292.1 hypothetical protein [Iodobacter sp. CM08]
MEVLESKAVLINAPEFFADTEFQTWLNNGKSKFTWHCLGKKPSDMSDVVVLVDPELNGEGADSDMPEHIWEQILTVCRSKFKPKLYMPHILVRLTNIN